MIFQHPLGNLPSSTKRIAITLVGWFALVLPPLALHAQEETPQPPVPAEAPAEAPVAEPVAPAQPRSPSLSTETLEQRLEREREALRRRLEELDEIEAELDGPLPEDADATRRQERREAQRQRTPRPERDPSDRDDFERRRYDNRVSLGNRVHVRKGERVREVSVVGASARIDGAVDRDVVVFGEDIDINGTVGGDVTAVFGDVRLGPDAVVEGNASSIGGEVTSKRGATVEGEISDMPFGGNLDLDDVFDTASEALPWAERRSRPLRRILALGWAVLQFGFLFLLCALVVLLVPRQVDRVARLIREETIWSTILGLGAEIAFLPVFVMVILILTITLIGIFLLPVLLPFLVLGFVLAAFFGFVAFALTLGRLFSERLSQVQGGSVWLLFWGLVLLSSPALFGQLLDVFGFGPFFFVSVLFKAIGAVFVFVAFTVGLGAVLLALVGRRLGLIEATAGGAAASWDGDTLPPLPGTGGPLYDDQGGEDADFPQEDSGAWLPEDGEDDLDPDFDPASSDSDNSDEPDEPDER